MESWEEMVPLLSLGYHRELAEKAYGGGEKVFPHKVDLFAALEKTSFSETRVVIIGQDPYFNERDLGPEAHGLCFSVRQGQPVPPSLRNIFKEIGSSVYGESDKRFNSDLSRWAQQGVLLLNASLTVVAGRANSHARLGWHSLTDDIIETISRQKEHVVFMLWGAFAQKKQSLIDGKRHCLLSTSHPSPLSAYRGFLGSDVFVRCNEYLGEHGLEPIVW
ncbi:uracil-DNA glycosylase [Desulfotalea psychrophila]|uniref:Uracil-DNA glycosylase n=1 Tax=Desulfotalea psychrophila (strain LSv54 / DSM 12343) TaxID=177439 RepID=Q6AK12_DESPS|nr:uracil-DNA glycosylase [Desulfotalea psychrophila]CAG37314.1 probable uracil-DNA glycosylase [Desulfotalea psychrophila LSv54]